MAVSLTTIRSRLRARLRDMDDRRPSFDPIEYDQAIAEKYLELAADLPAPELYTASGLTIAAGGDTFTMPTTVTGYGSAEYRGGIRIRLRSTGQFLEKRSIEYLDSLRHGSITPFLAIPANFCLWVEAAGTVQGRCYPGAKAAEVCDTYVSLAASDLRDYVGTGSDGMDDVTLLFSRQAASALVFLLAADMLDSMNQEDLALRRLNPQVSAVWRVNGKRLLYQAEAAKLDTEDSGYPERWVS